MKRSVAVALQRASGRVLFGFARSGVGGMAARWAFAHAADRLPVQVLYETDTVIAFRHPRPSYRVHVLIVPKKGIASLAAIEAADLAIMGDIVLAAQRVVAMLGLERQGYRLLVNGGAYQDVGQLHFHLISE